MTTSSGSIEQTKHALRNAFLRGQRNEDPYTHWLLSDLLPEGAVDDITHLPIGAPEMDYSIGTRESNNANRRYFDVDSREKFPVCESVSQAFQSPEVLAAIESTCGVDLTGTYLRIEYTQDGPGFWLSPHTDIGVKAITILIYLSSDPDAKNWGTTIYRDAETPVGPTPYAANHALMFVPGENTWHGYEKRPMDGMRKSLIVNFVRKEWRARHELAFPAAPVPSR